MKSRPSSTLTRAASSQAEGFSAWLSENGIAISMDRKGRWGDYIFIERIGKSIKSPGDVSVGQL